MNKKGMIGNLIGGIISIGIGIMLFPMITEQIDIITSQCNNSSGFIYNDSNYFDDSNSNFCNSLKEEGSMTSLFINQLPYFFLVTVILFSSWIAWNALKGSAGDCDEDEDNDDDDDDEEDKEDEDKEEDIKTEELEETIKDEKKYKKVMATKDDDELEQTVKSSSHYEKQRNRYMEKMQRFKDKKIVDEDKLNKTQFD